jgi:osmotically-inducible protein OsmY
MDPQEEYLIGRIQNALATDVRVHKQDVSVLIRGGKIHLTGQTSTEERRHAVEAVVAETAPGFEIKNELTIIEMSGPAQPEIICD